MLRTIWKRNKFFRQTQDELQQAVDYVRSALCRTMNIINLFRHFLVYCIAQTPSSGIPHCIVTIITYATEQLLDTVPTVLQKNSLLLLLRSPAFDDKA